MSTAPAPSREADTIDPTPQSRPWALYIYMKPDAALEFSAARDIEEMKQAARSTGIHVVVQLERGNDIERLVVADGDAALAPGQFRRAATSQDNLKAFVQWASAQYPGERRMLIVWGHSRGVGVDLTGPTAAPPPFGLSPAERRLRRIPSNSPPADAVPIKALVKVAFEAAEQEKPFDVIGFDSCYMSSLEFACEFDRAAHYLVAAQGYLKRTGWDYRAILEAAADAAGGAPVEPKVLAERIVRHVDRLEGNTNLARIDLGRVAPLNGDAAAKAEAEDSPEGEGDEPQAQRAAPIEPGIVPAFRDLVALLLQAIVDPIEARALAIALKRTSYLQVRQFLDLRDLCFKLIETFDAQIGRAAKRVLDEYELMVFSRATGGALGVLNGVSVYCPLFQAERSLGGASADIDAVVDMDEYASLRFVRGTRWLELCQQLDKATR